MRTFEHNPNYLAVPGKTNESASIFEGIDRRFKTNALPSGGQTQRGRQMPVSQKPNQQLESVEQNLQKQKKMLE